MYKIKRVHRLKKMVVVGWGILSILQILGILVPIYGARGRGAPITDY